MVLSIRQRRWRSATLMLSITVRVKINAAKDLSLESAVFNSDAEGKIAAGNDVNIRTYELFDNKGDITANNNLSLDMT
ncbi:hypothetical protein, partial [Cronobacter malonaticus]|uniref:hypothetical protein n=1 Tax=Cronobacter malonaticus TaxID=413503 RepID=UPI001F3D1D92